MITLEQWEAERAEQNADRPWLNETCGRCGHRKGAHSMVSGRGGCTIGGTAHNRHYKRHDAKCSCRGYATAEVVAAERAAEEQAEREREAMPYECDSCDERFADLSGCEPLYECGDCGTRFVSDEGNRCSSCNKFAAKESDHGCTSCEAGEVVLREGFDGESTEA